eukprot:m.203381 g.203381  ORF g.203381 m.203381 type:complete len:193 (+) comp26001_c0_seq17:106-684(+)
MVRQSFEKPRGTFPVFPDAPAEAQEIFHHVWKGLHRCEELEQHYNQLSWTADVPIFPLIVGKRSGRSSASGTHHSKVTNLSRGGLPMDHNQRLLRKDKIANSDTSDISHRNNGLSNGIHPDTATLSQFSEYSEVRPMKLQKRASSALSTGSHRSRSQVSNRLFATHIPNKGWGLATPSVGVSLGEQESVGES